TSTYFVGGVARCESAKKIRPLDHQPRQFRAQPAEGLVVLAAQMISAVVVAELVYEKLVDIIAYALLEPFATEAPDVEYQPSGFTAVTHGGRPVSIVGHFDRQINTY
nr:hypothetical protein [Pyrinomonadaceae bacterium]